MSLFLIIIISFLPILIWSYIFSYMDGDDLNKKKFLIGMFSGGISVIPIIYGEKIFNFLNLDIFYNVFSQFNLGKYFLFILLFFIIISISYILLSFIFSRNRLSLFKYLSFSFIVFLLGIGIFSILIFLINLFFPNISLDFSVNFGGFEIKTLFLLLFYYLFVSFSEEISKYFNFLSISFSDIKSVKKGVFYSFFISLGFVFIENILYMYNTYNLSGFGKDFLSVFVGRSIFSLMLHIFTLSLTVYFFSKMYLKYLKPNLLFSLFFLFGIILSNFIHIIFDLSIEFGYSFLILIFFLFGYFFITSIFYRE